MLGFLETEVLPRLCRSQALPLGVLDISAFRVHVGDQLETVFLLSGNDPAIHLYKEVRQGEAWRAQPCCCHRRRHHHRHGMATDPTGGWVLVLPERGAASV